MDAAMTAKRAAPPFRMPPRRTPKPTLQATKPYVRDGKKVMRPDGTPVLVADPDNQRHDRCVKCRKPGSTCGDCGVVLCAGCNTNPYPAAGHQPKAHLVPMDPKELEPKGRLKVREEHRQAQPAQAGLTIEQAIMQIIAKMERFMATNNPNPNPPQAPNPNPQPGTAQPAQTPNPAPNPAPKG